MWSNKFPIFKDAFTALGIAGVIWCGAVGIVSVTLFTLSGKVPEKPVTKLIAICEPGPTVGSVTNCKTVEVTGAK